MTWIQTRNGRRFDILKPRAADIEPDVIAVCLSRLCRFGGHCKSFYSVAQHSLHVCDLVSDPSLKLPALLHDAHECYWGFGDICRPAKLCLHRSEAIHLKDIQLAVDEAIGERFGFDSRLFECAKIKEADCVALATEQRDIMEPCEYQWDVPQPSPVLFIEPVDEQEAFRQFSARLYELWSD